MTTTSWSAGAAGEPVLRVEGVSKDFGGLRALDGVSFEVARGEILGVIGPNGAGKTTLLNIMSRFLAPTRGRVLYSGAPTDRSSPDALARRGMVRSFQDSQTFPTLTVRQTLVAAALSRRPMRKTQDVVDKLIADLGLETRAGLRQDQLSLPDRKLLEIAKCMAMEPTVMLLDEVMAGLALVEAEQPISLIESLKAAGITFVLIEHVMPVVTRLADRVVVLDFGRQIADGDPAEVLQDDTVRRSYLGVTDVDG